MRDLKFFMWYYNYVVFIKRKFKDVFITGKYLTLTTKVANVFLEYFFLQLTQNFQFFP